MHCRSGKSRNRNTGRRQVFMAFMPSPRFFLGGGKAYENQLSFELQGNIRKRTKQLWREKKVYKSEGKNLKKCHKNTWWSEYHPFSFSRLRWRFLPPSSRSARFPEGAASNKAASYCAQRSKNRCETDSAAHAGKLTWKMSCQGLRRWSSERTLGSCTHCVGMGQNTTNTQENDSLRRNNVRKTVDGDLFQRGIGLNGTRARNALEVRPAAAMKRLPNMLRMQARDTYVKSWVSMVWIAATTRSLMLALHKM
jgi:hypothetical protein